MTREEAIVFLDDIMTDCVYGITSNEKESCEMAIEVLKKLPVIHAHWIEYERAHYFKCSRCKLPVPYKKAMLHNGARVYNFCPSCGAIMDEEIKEVI